MTFSFAKFCLILHRRCDKRQRSTEGLHRETKVFEIEADKKRGWGGSTKFTSSAIILKIQYWGDGGEENLEHRHCSVIGPNKDWQGWRQKVEQSQRYILTVWEELRHVSTDSGEGFVSSQRKEWCYLCYIFNKKKKRKETPRAASHGQREADIPERKQRRSAASQPPSWHFFAFLCNN